MTARAVLTAASTAAVPVTVALVWARLRLVVVVIAGFSMQPAFRPGDRVLVRRTATGRVRRGQVVVLRPPGVRVAAHRPPGQREWIIKRAVAVPGDLCPPVVTRADPTRAPADGRVPPGWLAVLGDNPAVSADSRQFGLVPGDSVLGTVVRRLPPAA